MNDDVFPIPDIPGYINIKEAAKILGVAESSVYRYVQSGQLQAYQAGNNIMIKEETLQDFKLKPSGRPRKNTPPWRASSGDNTQYMTIIHVKLRQGQEEALQATLEQIRRDGLHTFPGTVIRSIGRSATIENEIVLVLSWRGTVMPPQPEREAALNALRHDLNHALDWSTARSEEIIVLLHT